MRLNSNGYKLELYNMYYHISIEKHSYKMCIALDCIMYFEYEKYTGKGLKVFSKMIRRSTIPAKQCINTNVKV